MTPVSADRAALTGKASRGNLTQPPSAAFHVVCAQSLLSLSYALYDPAAEKKRRGEREKKILQVQAWCGRDEYHRRILATKAFKRSNSSIIPLNGRDTGVRNTVSICVTRDMLSYFSLCSPKLALKERSQEVR